MEVGDKFVTLDVLKATNDHTMSKIGELQDALVAIPPSNNKLNPAEVTDGKQLDANGSEATYTGRSVTGYIPVTQGQYVHITGIKNNSVMSSPVFLRIVTYKSDKSKIDKGPNGYPVRQNNYHVVDDHVAYFRLCYENSTFSGVDPIAVLVNDSSSAPVLADIDTYRPLTYTAVDTTARDDIHTTRADTRVIVPDKYISCWGDSFIANGHGDSPRTSVCAYLAGLCGSGYYQANQGYSGQGSGEIAMKMGAVDVYVSMQNSQIAAGAAGTPNKVTRVHMTRGSVNQNFMQSNGTYTNGVSCIINGVNGYLWSYDTDDEGTEPEPYFTPSGNVASAVPVTPLTKVLVGASLHQNRYVVIWAGKNDFLHYGGASFHEYLADVISAMAESIPHNRFVILGVTTSLTDAYATGGAARTVMTRYINLMKRRYPENFIDIQEELMAPVEDQTYKVRGLELAGIPFGTDETLDPHHDMTDAEALAAGLLLPSLLSNGLMNGAADKIHPNAGCRLAVAKIIHAHMVAKGWL